MRKLSLVTTIAGSLLLVFTASVATYAWYTANASATVNTSSTSATISTTAPESIELGAATFYKYNGNGDYGYTGTISSSATIASNFTSVSAASITTTPVPGRKMTFAVQVGSSNSKNISNVDLQIISYSTVDKANRKVVNAAGTAIEQISSTDKYVRIEEAINIYAHVNSTGTYGTEGATDAFAFDYANPYNKSTTNLSLVPTLQRTVTPALTVYAFFTIEFSNSNTTYYKEYKKISNTSYTDTLYTTPTSDAADRFFHKETTGNSSCYEGMRFTLTSIKMIVG